MKPFVCYTVLLMMGMHLHAFPPPAPSAGVIEREIEKEYEGKPLEPDKEIPSIEIDIPEEKLQMPEGKHVLIRKVQIEGNEAYPAEEICCWLDGKLDRELSIVDVYELCQIIVKRYAEKGYFLARAYPPPQTIANGVLVIRILEGKLGQVEVEGNKRYSTRFIEKYFRGLKGHGLQYNRLMRSILLLNEFSDLSVGAVLKKGKEIGTVDLVLRVQDARPMHLYLNANNYGRKLTTSFRAGGRFDWGNAAVYGDTFSLAEVVGFPFDALYFTDVRYKAPVNANGTFVGAEFLYSQFKVEELTSLHLRGQSIIGTVKAEHAWFRRRNLNVDLFSFFDLKQIKNYTLGQITSFDKLRVLTFGTLIDHYTPNQGRDYFNFRMGIGIPSFLGGLNVYAPQSSRLGAGGRFLKFNADYDRLQHLREDCFLYIHASGQLSVSKLTLPEQIYIGGADTVRGYPLASALGDSGYYLNFELRLPMPILANQRFFVAKKKWREVVQVVGFLDHGGVFLDGGGEFFQTSHRIFLWGSGLGFRLKGPKNLALSLDVGWPLNHDRLSSGAFTYLKVTGQPF